MSIVTEQTPMGWQAYDSDDVDGESPVTHGVGRTEAEALDDLRAEYIEQFWTYAGDDRETLEACADACEREWAERGRTACEVIEDSFRYANPEDVRALERVARECRA